MHFQNTAAECRLSRVCSCQDRWAVRLLFSLLECTFSAEVGAIRRTVVFGVFQRYSALFGAFRRFLAHARGEI